MNTFKWNKIMNTFKWNNTLKRILAKATISPTLRDSVLAMAQALKEKDYELAYQISACKSLITGVINPKDKTSSFQEDQDHNEKVLRNSVYCLLDCFHHNMAWALDQIPSGMMVVGKTRDGKLATAEMKHKGTHPIVKRIIYESKQIEKKVYK